MNEVILIRPFTRKKAPIGLFSIASILNHNDYSVRFLDQTVTCSPKTDPVVKLV